MDVFLCQWTLYSVSAWGANAPVFLSAQIKLTYMSDLNAQISL